jgi:hypothetical protein
MYDRRWSAARIRPVSILLGRVDGIQPVFEAFGAF